MIILSTLLIILVAVFTALYIKRKKIKAKLEKERLHKLSVLQEARQLIQGASLSTLFRVHKMLGENNLCNNHCICPNKYGVFRTSNIATMDESEVFLGNIYGLWTYTLPYWESCKDEDAKEKVTNQYYQLLLRGIELEHQKYEKVHS